MWNIFNLQVNIFMRLINKAARHGDVCESQNISTSFLTSALEGGKWPTSRFGRIAPR